MRFFLGALSALASFAALADDAPKRLTAADLSVETHKWDGKTIQATGQCFFADVSQYRCALGILGTVFVRLDLSRRLANRIPMRGVALIFATCLLPGPALADGPDGNCYTMMQRFVAAGLQFKRTSTTESLGDMLFFDDPLQSQVTLACGKLGMDVNLGWDRGANPSELWYGLAATLGSLTTGANEKTIEVALRRCIRQALEDKSELSDVETPKIRVDCQAFTRDGGGVSVDIYTPTN
jgi:hypothetical protein